MGDIKLVEVSTEQMVNMLEITVAEAEIDGIIHPLLLDVFFNVNLVLTMTDILVDSNDLSNKLALNDVFAKAGIYAEVQKLLAEEGTNLPDLKMYLDIWVEKIEMQRNSFVGQVEGLKILLTEMMDGINDSLANLDSTQIENLKNVIPIAKAAGIDFKEETD